MSCLTGKLAAAAIADPALRAVLQDIVCALGPQGTGQGFTPSWGYANGVIGQDEVSDDAPITMENIQVFGSILPSGAGFVVGESGWYRVDYGITSFDDNQIALFKTGTLIPLTTFGIEIAPDATTPILQNRGTVILLLAVGDIVDLRNVTGAPIDIAENTGGTTVGDINRYLMITRLSLVKRMLYVVE